MVNSLLWMGSARHLGFGCVAYFHRLSLLNDEVPGTWETGIYGWGGRVVGGKSANSANSAKKIEFLFWQS